MKTWIAFRAYCICLIVFWSLSMAQGEAEFPGESSAQAPSAQRRPPKPVPIDIPGASSSGRPRYTIMLDFILDPSLSTETTRVTLPGNRQWQFVGEDRIYKWGGAASGEVRLPGALRRITAGSMFGVTKWPEPQKIPAVVATPFVRESLSTSISSDLERLPKKSYTYLMSPYIEHDLLALFGRSTLFPRSRLRVGYQYWNEHPRVIEGSFDQRGIRLGYDVQSNENFGHMARISWDFLAATSDEGGGVFRAGVLVGADRRVVVFLGVGGFFSK